MLKETKRLLTVFCFVNTVIICAVAFFCGTLTASEKTAYNIYLREYSVLSMINTSESINMDVNGKSLTVNLPPKDKLDKLRRYLKLTPFATVVYFGEMLEEILS
ncbi:MAG: hypothetical protein IKJ27_00955 [Clostridia bacterium]|nr:hypothetical protein [Clostridia bacterium]